MALTQNKPLLVRLGDGHGSHGLLFEPLHLFTPKYYHSASSRLFRRTVAQQDDGCTSFFYRVFSTRIASTGVAWRRNCFHWGFYRSITRYFDINSPSTKGQSDSMRWSEFWRFFLQEAYYVLTRMVWRLNGLISKFPHDNLGIFISICSPLKVDVDDLSSPSIPNASLGSLLPNPMTLRGAYFLDNHIKRRPILTKTPKAIPPQVQISSTRTHIERNGHCGLELGNRKVQFVEFVSPDLFYYWSHSMFTWAKLGGRIQSTGSPDPASG